MRLITSALCLVTSACLITSCGKHDSSDVFRNAVKDGDINTCRDFLNKNGSLASTHDTKDAPPLWLAAGNGHADIVSLLLSHGANPNATEPYLNSAPLHIASGRGHVRVVEILIQAGANVNASDKAGQRPYDMAELYSRSDVQALLKRYGGGVQR